MELYQIRYFLELNKYQHMSVAADLLHISQPALSRSISALEKELGIQLYDRVGKHIRLNKNGERFAVYAEKACRMLELGVQSAKDVRYEIAGNLSVLNYFYGPAMTGCLASYARLNPYVHLKLSQFFLGQNLKGGDKPDFILCISGEVADSGQPNQFWVWEPLFEEDYLLAASDTLLPLPPEQESVELAELEAYPFVVMPQTSIFFRDATFSVCHDAGFYAKVPYQTDTYGMKLDLAAQGAALAIVPGSCAAQDRPAFRNLRTYRISGCRRRCQVGIFRQKKALMTESALDFWDYVLDYYGRPADTRE